MPCSVHSYYYCLCLDPAGPVWTRLDCRGLRPLLMRALWMLIIFLCDGLFRGLTAALGGAPGPRTARPVGWTSGGTLWTALIEADVQLCSGVITHFFPAATAPVAPATSAARRVSALPVATPSPRGSRAQKDPLACRPSGAGRGRAGRGGAWRGRTSHSRERHRGRQVLDVCVSRN